MPGGINVGTVYVDVRPDARGWVRELRAQLLPPTSKVGDEMGETIAKPVKEKLRDAIPEGLRAGGRKSRTTAAKEGEESGGAFAKSFRSRVEAATKNLPEITLNVNTGRADVSIKRLQERLKALRDANLGVDLDAGEARAEIEDLAKELRTLSREDARLDVRVDAGAAAAELEALRREIDSLDGKEIDIKVDNNSFLSASAYQSHIRKIIQGIVTLAPAATAAIAGITGGALGLVAALGAAGGGAGAFGLALIGSVANAGAAAKDLNKLETQLDAATDAAQRFKIVGQINTLLGGLSKPTKDFISELEDLKASWQAFITATGPRSLAVAGAGLEVLEKALAPLPDLVNAVTPTFGRFVDTIDGFVSGTGYQTFLGFLKTEAPPALQNLARLMGGLAAGIGGVIAAFTPFGQQFLSVLADGAQRFAAWGQQLGASSGFREFIAYISSTGPQVFDVLKDLASAVISIGTALAPLSGPTLTILQTLARVLDLVAESAPGLVATAAGLYAVTRAATAFGNVVNGVRGKVDSLRTAVGSGKGGLGGAVSGLRGGLGAVSGALGGPWGLAITAGITGLGLLANAHAKAKQRSDELKASLNQTTGAVEAEARANIAKTLQETGAVKISRELGLSAHDVQLAAEGNAEAYKRVTTQIDELTTAQKAQRDEASKGTTAEDNKRFLELNDTYAKTTVNARKLLDIIGVQNKDIAEQRVVIKETNALYGGWLDTSSGLRFATKAEADAHAAAGREIRAQRNALIELADQQKRNRTEALGMANAELGYNQALLSVKEGLKDNKKTIDSSTQAGLSNRANILALAQAQNQLADDVKFTQKPFEDQIRILKQQRADFIAAAESVGYNKTQAAALADQYLKMPAEVSTQAKLETQDQKLEDWKKGIDPGIPAQRNTQTSIIMDALGLGQWKNQIETIPRTQSTAGSIIKDALGLGSWKNSVETIPGTKETKGKVVPDYAGIQNTKEALNSIPSTKTVSINFVRTTTYKSVYPDPVFQGQGQHGGVVGDTIMKGYAHGGVVDMRAGGTQPGFSLKDNRIGLFRDGEAVLVPEVTKALGGRKTIEELNKAGSQIIQVLRDALGIHSPSKAMIELGRWMAAGLVKGLTSSVEKAQSTFKTLSDKIYSAFTKQFTDREKAAASAQLKAARRRGSSRGIAAAEERLRNASSVGAARGKSASAALMKSLADENKRIQAIAKARESVAAKLKAAQDKLADAIKAREDFAKSVREDVMGFGSITDLSSGTPTAQGMIEELKARVQASQQFAKTLADLRKKGLNLTTYRQLVEAGVDTGGPIAQALLEGGTGAIKEINSLTSQLGVTAKNLGAASARELYQAGVDSAQALVRGLQSQAKALASAAKKLADQIVKYLKRALKIKSPSQKLADEVGQFLPLGVAQGIEQHPDAIGNALMSQVSMAYGAKALASQGIQTGEYNPGKFTKGNTNGGRQPIYLVLEDGTKFSAYIDNRADGRLSAAARRAKTGVKR